MPEEIDDEEQESLEVNIIIDEEDQIIFDAINSIDKQQRSNSLLRWARLGHLVSGLVEVETNQGTLTQYFAIRWPMSFKIDGISAICWKSNKGPPLDIF